MADHGEVALRMLDPQWTTLHGTVRAWLHHGRIRRRLAERAEEMGGAAAVIGVVASSARGGPMPAEETETVTRFWIERDGRSRYEFLAPDGRVERTAIDDGRSSLVVPEHGQILRTERGQSSSGHVWIGDPRVLVGNVRLRFGHDESVAGRAAVRVETVPVAGEREMFPRHLPLERGIISGAGGYAIVDVGSGLLLRYEVRDTEGRPISRHEFVTIEVDEPMPEETFTYEIPPERMERTPTDIQLEMLERAGVDVSEFDRTDVERVRRAMDEHFRSIRDEEPVGRMTRRGRRPLAETVAPLGPPPDDESAAREQIAAAVTALAPDGRPKEGRIERGEVLDRSGPEPVHPVARGRTVTAELRDLVFLREDEALIEFEIRVSGGPNPTFPGRAVRRSGRWLVSYETAAHLREMGGNPAPSLLDPPPDDGPAE
ncbi:MAG TPA: hypothetical protein VIY72_03810 [Acidimicrobiales bacterium]